MTKPPADKGIAPGTELKEPTMRPMKKYAAAIAPDGSTGWHSVNVTVT